MNALTEIQDWYISECDGDWEHCFGVQIQTLDNPGWSVSIDLSGTSLEEEDFDRIAHGVGAEAEEGCDDWLVCEVKEKKFLGHGGPQKLEEILGIFLRWKNVHPAASDNGDKSPFLS